VLLTFSLNSVSFHLAAALGPPIGTLLLRVAGPGAAFTANAVSYLAVVAGIAAVPRRPWARTPFPGVRRSMGELYTFVRTSQRSRRLLVTSAVVSVLAFGLPAVLPAFATEVLGGGSGSYGSLMGAMGAGSLSGAVVMGVLSSRVTRRTIIVAGAWLVGAGALALGTTSLMSPALSGMWALGTGQLMLLVTSRTIIQMDAPEPLRARAVGLWFVFSVGAGPLGGALLGWSADLFGVATAVRAIALYGPLLAVALTIAAYTSVGRLRRAAATTGP
jgi:MFS family permease